MISQIMGNIVFENFAVDLNLQASPTSSFNKDVRIFDSSTTLSYHPYSQSKCDVDYIGHCFSRVPSFICSCGNAVLAHCCCMYFGVVDDFLFNKMMPTIFRY